jgi:hypothetical protein
MATTLEQLLVEIRLQGAAPTKQQLKDIKKEVQDLEGALSMLGTLGGMTFFISQIGELARTFVQVSGVAVAAEFMGISRALEALTGSGQKAANILRQLKELGRTTAFDTADVSSVAGKMLGAGVTEGRLMPELQALLDLASHGMGLSRQDFPEFMRNLLQIRGRTTGKADLADINQLKDRVPQIGAFLAAGIGGGVSREDALKKAQSMTGRQLYDTIIKGSEAMARGAAAAKALRDPIAALGNLFENLRMTMEPTGKLLLMVGMPVLGLANKITTLLLKVNEWTFGLAGLAVLIGGAVYLATRTATKALIDFSKAMLATATSTRVGTNSTLTNATSGLIKSLPFIGTAAIITEMVSGAIAGDRKNPTRAATGDFLSNLLFTNPLYAYGKSIWDAQQQPANAAADPMVKEQKRTNKLLEDLKLTPWGGGLITARTVSDFEAQYALKAMYAT